MNRATGCKHEDDKSIWTIINNEKLNYYDCKVILSMVKERKEFSGHQFLGLTKEVSPYFKDIDLFKKS